jgi:hypothetical protein
MMKIRLGNPNQDDDDDDGESDLVNTKFKSGIFTEEIVIGKDQEDESFELIHPEICRNVIPFPTRYSKRNGSGTQTKAFNDVAGHATFHWNSTERTRLNGPLFTSVHSLLA